MMLTGKAIDAKRAKRMGLVDQAVPLRILENTARMVTLEAPQARELPLFRGFCFPSAASSFRQARKQVAKRARREHYPAPYAILDAWQKYDGDPVPRGERPVLLDDGAVRAPDHAQPDPHFLPAGAHEGPRQGRGLQGAARARGGRRRDGRRHRRALRHARHHRDAAGHLARAHRAGGAARGERCSSAGCASRAASATPWTG